MRMKFAKAVVGTVLIVSLLWASGVSPAIIPAGVPTANKQGSTGTKFLICAGSFTPGNTVATDAQGNCVDSGGPASGGNGLTVYSGLAGVTISGGVTAYFPFGGGSSASLTETSVTVNLRTAATVANFTSHLSAALGGPGNTVAFTLRKNAADTTITCTITDPAVECSDTAHTVGFASGDTIDVKAVFVGVIAPTPVFVLGAVVGAISSPAVTSVFGQNGTVNIPVTTTDIATPANPGAGATKWYTKAGTLCSLSPAGTETCTGSGGGATFYPTNGSLMGPAWALTLPPAAGWTFNNQGTSTTNTTDGYLYLLMTKTSSVSIRAYCRAAPATPYSVYMLILRDISGMPVQTAGIAEVKTGIGFSDGTKYYNIGSGYSNGNPNTGTDKWNTTASYNSTTVSTFAQPVENWVSRNPQWYRISDDGTTNITFYFSLDGNNWVLFDQQPRLGFLTAVTNVCIWGYVNTHSAQMSVLNYSTSATP